MKPSNHEQSKRHAFDSFCKKILKNEARDHYDELKRQRKKEKSFSDLSLKEMDQLYTVDKYFITEQIFNVLGLDVIVTDDVIVGALENLPEQKCVWQLENTTFGNQKCNCQYEKLLNQ